MAHRAGFDTARLDVGVDIVLLQTDDPAELVGRQLAFVDEAVERARRDAEPLGGRRGGQPHEVVVGFF